MKEIIEIHSNNEESFRAISSSIDPSIFFLITSKTVKRYDIENRKLEELHKVTKNYFTSIDINNKNEIILGHLNGSISLIDKKNNIRYINKTFFKIRKKEVKKISASKNNDFFAACFEDSDIIKLYCSFGLIKSIKVKKKIIDIKFEYSSILIICYDEEIKNHGYNYLFYRWYFKINELEFLFNAKNLKYKYYCGTLPKKRILLNNPFNPKNEFGIYCYRGKLLKRFKSEKKINFEKLYNYDIYRNELLLCFYDSILIIDLNKEEVKAKQLISLPRNIKYDIYDSGEFGLINEKYIIYGGLYTIKIYNKNYILNDSY
ncbi:hypothetical protein V6O07_22510 [Arthrospira platensis SPKY2]